MAITWGEIPNSAKTTKDSTELHFLLDGGSDSIELADPIVARAFALGYSSAIFNGLYRSDLSLDERGPLLYEATITYGLPDTKEPEAGDSKWSFDTTGATRRVTHAIQHIASYVPSGRVVTDHNGVIGFKKSGEADGVDVPDRSFKWQENRQLLMGSYGFAYATVLGAYTGLVNSAPFRGFPAYTVLFGGA